MTRALVAWIGIGVALLLAPVAQAVPALLSQQGVLLDPAGEPTNGAFDLIVRFYDAKKEGALLWEEEHEGVDVAGGVFSLTLGATTSLDLDALRDQPSVWVEIQVGAEKPLPRTRVLSVAYALLAVSADVSGDLACTGCIGGSHIAAASVAAEHLGPGAVGTAALADGSVTGAKIAAGAVALAHLAPGACPAGSTIEHTGGEWACGEDADTKYTVSTGLEMAADNVISVAAGGITGAEVKDGSIGLGDLAPCAQVGQIAVFDGANWVCGTDSVLTKAQVEGFAKGVCYDVEAEVTAFTDALYVNVGEANSVLTGMIKDGDVQNADLAAGAVTSDKIEDATVGLADLAPCTAAGQELEFDGAKWICGTDSVLTKTQVEGYAKGVCFDVQTEVTAFTDALYVNAGEASSVLTGMIKDGEVQNADLAANAVTSDKIKDATIGLADLAPCTAAGQELEFDGTKWICGTDGMLTKAQVEGYAKGVCYDAQTEVTAFTDALYVNAGEANSVLTGMIKDGEVKNADLATGAVTSDKILNDTIVAADIATDAVGAAEIATDAVGAAEIATDAVGAAEIATGAVGAAEIATGAVGAAEIATDAVGAAEIAASAVGTSELAAGAVTFAKLDGAVKVNEAAKGCVAAGAITLATTCTTTLDCPCIFSTPGYRNCDGTCPAGCDTTVNTCTNAVKGYLVGP